MKRSQSVVSARRKDILAYLQNHRSEQISVLAEIFHVNSITIRRDLDLLAEDGFVQRSYGKAICMLPQNVDVQYQTPQGDPTPSRCAIAKVAASFIENGDLVLFNSSSTALFILNYLSGIRASIITNNGRALYVRREPGIDLFLTGGEIYGNKQSLVGDIAVSALSTVMASKCFLGVSGISCTGGITSAVMQETAINRAILNHCSGPKIVVADSTKIGVTRSFYSGSISDITHLITDSCADPELLEELHAAGVEVIIANISN